jgi:ubiquinone/menaquinone biosynthesis C-methylase UbiE
MIASLLMIYAEGYMRSAFWKENWNKSACENDDIRLISGWGNRSLDEMLFSINDIAEKLRLHQNDRLLDIGCGAGIFEIAFARWMREVIGSDFSDEMVKKARKNSKNSSNVHIQQCTIKALPYKSGVFDKILVNSVIQYLDGYDEVISVIDELDRITRTGGIILLSLIPSADSKNALLDGYFSLGLSDTEIQEKVTKNENILWFNKQELVADLTQKGFSKITASLPCNCLQKKYYFDLIIEKY